MSTYIVFKEGKNYSASWQSSWISFHLVLSVNNVIIVKTKLNKNKSSNISEVVTTMSLTLNINNIFAHLNLRNTAKLSPTHCLSAYTFYVFTFCRIKITMTGSLAVCLSLAAASDGCHTVSYSIDKSPHTPLLYPALRPRRYNSNPHTAWIYSVRR